MPDNYRKAVFLLSLMLIVFSGIAAEASNIPITWEEQGIEPAIGEAMPNGHHGGNEIFVRVPLPQDEDVLLIPNSIDDYIGMYDPYTGNFLGIFIDSFEQFQTPICAMEGPDKKIFISDQVADAVFVFDRDGEYLETYADASDGLNNIRGIDFRDGILYVTSGMDYVAAFDGPHSRLDNFIDDGSDSFDILFLDNGLSLLSDIEGTQDNVRLYDYNGGMIRQIFSVSFPQQLKEDPMEPGNYLNAGFSSDVIVDFDTVSYMYQTNFEIGRGVHRLGNGNLLVTNNDGVFELHQETGQILSVKSTGSSRFIELIPADDPSSIGEDNRRLPGRVTLLHNYPNPFNASTSIRYRLQAQSQVTIEIYDLLGRRLDIVQNGLQQAGEHQAIWDASSRASGVYFYRVKANDNSHTGKMILLK